MEEKKNSQVETIIESISKLSVLELAELVKALEEKFGVSPTMMAAPVGSVAAEEPQEEKSAYNLVLTDAGANKIAVIKAVREVNQALGLKEAFGELKRVTWPKREEVVYLTLLVIGVCLGLGLFFAGIDFLFTQFINLIL